MPDRIPSTPVRARAGRWRCLSLACLLALFAVWSGPASAEEPGWRDVATPLRLVNLNPFHLMYGVPSAYGARVLAPGSSEVIASMDMASHLRRGIGDSEQVLIDGETYRQALALRYGFQPGWEFLLEVSAVSHSRGHFDGFIENWHDFFGLPQSGRDTEPRNRLEMVYVRDGEALVDIDDGVSSLGDMTLGVGYALPSTILANDGLVLRSALKLPTGDEGALAGSGGLSASVWAETSGSLSGSARIARLALHGSAGRSCRRAARRPFDDRRASDRLRAVRRDLAAIDRSVADGAGSTFTPRPMATPALHRSRTRP